MKPRFNPARSGYEKKVMKFFDANKIQYAYEQHKLTYIKHECKQCGAVVQTGTYTPDFQIQPTNGDSFFVEAKGYFDVQDRSKMILVMQSNPMEDIRLLFQRDNPIRKGSKTKYSDWAAKHGFKFHISNDGSLPKEWLE